MRFCFQLTPLPKVVPWGTERKTLHWFGLTDGWFWVEVAGQELFRSSEAAMRHWARQHPEYQPALPYEDYQIVRYWEDLLDIIPAVLDPLPDDLAGLVADHDGWKAWQRRANAWMEQQDTDEAWDIYYTATGWWDGRRWYSQHLSKSPRIWLWRVRDVAHVRWDNRDVTLDGLPVWAAHYGEATMPMEEFQDAVADFHARLMAAMADRVAEARRSWPFPDVEIDLDHLEREQRERPTWLENALSKPARDYEWDKVRQAMARIKAEIGG